MGILAVQNLNGLTVNVTPAQTVLEALTATGTDWMHACGMKGRCTTCRVKVLAGMEYFSPETAAELNYRAKGRLLPDERLTCQCTVPEGEVLVKVPKQVQLPHLKYTN